MKTKGALKYENKRSLKQREKTIMCCKYVKGRKPRLWGLSAGSCLYMCKSKCVNGGNINKHHKTM